MPERTCSVIDEKCPCHPEVYCRDCPTWHNRSDIWTSRARAETNKKLDKILEMTDEILKHMGRLEKK